MLLWSTLPLLYPLFSLEKGYINFAPKFVHHLSVCPSIHRVSCKYLHLSHLMEQLQTLYLDRSHAVGGTGQYFVLIMYFLVNASPTKPLDVATLNFVPD